MRDIQLAAATATVSLLAAYAYVRCTVNPELAHLRAELRELKELLKSSLIVSSNKIKDLDDINMRELQDDNLLHCLENFLSRKNLADAAASTTAFSEFFLNVSTPTMTLCPLSCLQDFEKFTFTFEDPEALFDSDNQSFGKLHIDRRSFCAVNTFNTIRGSGNTPQKLADAVAQIIDSNTRMMDDDGSGGGGGGGAGGGGKEFRPRAQSLEEQLSVAISPARQITLVGDARCDAGIPDQASHYCYCYPLARTRMTFDEGLDVNDPILNLLMHGGFVYFENVNSQPIHAIQTFSTHRASKALTLGKSQVLPDEVVHALEKWGRWFPVTLWNSDPKIKLEHCWITPKEEISGRRFTRSGGFGYRVKQRTSGGYAAAAGGEGASAAFYVPVVGGKTKDPARYHIEEIHKGVFFPELQQRRSSSASAGGEEATMAAAAANPNKFFVPSLLITGGNLGLSTNVTVRQLLGIDANFVRSLKADGCNAIKREFDESGTEEERAIFDYVYVTCDGRRFFFFLLSFFSSSAAVCVV